MRDLCNLFYFIIGDLRFFYMQNSIISSTMHKTETIEEALSLYEPDVVKEVSECLLAALMGGSEKHILTTHRKYVITVQKDDYVTGEIFYNRFMIGFRANASYH